MKKIFSPGLLIATLFLLSTTAFANPDGPEEGVDPVPVNGWVIPVLVAGVVFAFTKLKQPKKA